MQDGDVFRVNGPQAISENIDGEVVLVNLDKGIYYSTDQVGAAVWDLIEAGHGVAGLCRVIGTRYEGDGPEIAAAISTFLSELLREELIVARSPDRERTPIATSPAPGLAARIRFGPPVLNKYTDMKDMLMLDPIHDVEVSGWPAPKTTP